MMSWVRFSYTTFLSLFLPSTFHTWSCGGLKTYYIFSSTFIHIIVLTIKSAFCTLLRTSYFRQSIFLFHVFALFAWLGTSELKLMLCCYFLETDGSYLCLLCRSKLNNMKNLTQLLMKYSFDHCTEFFLVRFSIGRWHSETVQLSNKLKLLCVMFSFKI